MSRHITLILGTLTGLGILGYWLSVLIGFFPVVELVPGYRAWFLSFPLPDMWIALCATLLVWYTVKQHERASLFGLLTGSSLIFLGLYAFAYGVNTELVFNLTPDELIEIAIKLYCLSAGALLIIHSWKLRAVSNSQTQSLQEQPIVRGEAL